MRKRTETTHKATRTITMPDEVDLTTYNSLDVSFMDGKGNEILNLQFRRDADTLPQLAINVIGPNGDVISALTLFDLEV
ncbi:MAG: hypothetical protein AABN33_05045 [Acidobacteriota bacterium]